MKLPIIILVLLFVCSYGGYLKDGFVLGTTKKDFGNVRNCNIDCGTFLSECWDKHKVHVILKGYIDSVPLDIFVSHLLYDTETCMNDPYMYVRVTGDVVKHFDGNSTYIHGDVQYHTAYVTIYNQALLSSWSCKQPVEINKEYDVSVVNCTDSTGRDVFLGYRGVDQIVETIDLTFTKDYLIHANHPFYRLSYEGCFSTPEFTSLLVILSIVVLLLLVFGGVLINKYSHKVADQKKKEKEKSKLLYS